MKKQVPLAYHWLAKSTSYTKESLKGSEFPQKILTTIIVSLLVLFIFSLSFQLAGHFLTQDNAGNSQIEYYLGLANLFLKANDIEKTTQAIAIAQSLGAQEKMVAPLKEKLAQTQAQYRVIHANLLYWQDQVQKFPAWRDAWIEVARYSYMLGDFAASKSALRKALDLDPNYPPALTLLESNQLQSVR